MKGDKHNHHYIPDFILRRFQYNDDPKKSKVHLIDLATGKMSKVVKTKKIYTEDNLYRVRIEDAMGKYYEGPVNSILKRVEESDSIFEVSIKDVFTLRKYLLLQLVRTKDEMESYSDKPEVWDNLINKCVSKESLQSMIKTSHPYIRKLSEFFLYAPILFIKAKGEFIMPDGGLMESYIPYPKWIDPDIIRDENGKPRIENGVDPGCPPGSIVNYMFYPMGPEYGALLLNPLWHNKDYVTYIGSNTYSIDPVKILEYHFSSIPIDESERHYQLRIMPLDEEETIRLVKETLYAASDTLVARNLKLLQTALSELVVEKPDYRYREQAKMLINTLKDV